MGTQLQREPLMMFTARAPVVKTNTRQQGFSMLELIVAGLLIVVLATVSYRQYTNIVVDAERAAFSGVRGWLQAGVNLAMSDAIGKRNRTGLAELEGSNPMRLLDGVLSLPSNYLGELEGEAAIQAASGNWYFDLDQRTLYYRFRFRQAMEGFERAQNDRIGFRLKLVRSSADNGTSRTRLVLIVLPEPGSGAATF
ncbi:MAG: prepilin-type N-terminal cleavage/methylation domain-containing protein [Halopseudomonas sp.]